MTRGRSWTREEDLAVLYVKLARKERSAIGILAKAMNRTEASIAMRKGNFDSLDPAAGRGLSNAASQTKSIWQEYQDNPQLVRREARKAFQAVRHREPVE